MPDVSPPYLVERRGQMAETMKEHGIDWEPFSPPGICEFCIQTIDQEKEPYVIGLDGCWAHTACLASEAGIVMPWDGNDA